MIPLAQRTTILTLLDEARAAGARLSRACEVIGLSIRTVQRWRQNGSEPSEDGRRNRVFQPPNKLTDAERAEVLATANSAQFAERTPAQIVPILAEQGRYIASESTFYRLLREHNQLTHRHRARAPSERRRPTPLCAWAPNQVYCWDITYLPSAVRGMFFYLYLFMDLYSRKIVGWKVHERECNEHAAALIAEIAVREGVEPGQVVLHADNGGPMKGATMLAMLERLGVATSFSRPSVSNDNPYAESLFRTAKYHPSYPDSAFELIVDATDWTSGFVHWYNYEHRHSALKFVTPHQRHTGQDVEILAKRDQVYCQARDNRPDRWTGATRNWQPDTVVYLNPEKDSANHRRSTHIENAT